MIPPVTFRRRAAAALAVPALLAGCRNGPPTPSAAAFCRRIEANRPALTGPVLDAAEQVLAAYRNVGAVAPVAVRDAWTTVTALLESATALDTTEPKAAEALAARALAAKPEIDRIVTYARTTCDIDIGAALPAAPGAEAPAANDPAGVDPAAVDPGATTTEAPGTIPPTVAPTNP